MKLLTQLVSQGLHLSEKKSGKVMEFHKPLAVATILDRLQPHFLALQLYYLPVFLTSYERLLDA